MKQLIALILCLTIAVSLFAACGKEPAETTSTTTVPPETTVPPTTEPTADYSYEDGLAALLAATNLKIKTTEMMTITTCVETYKTEQTYDAIWLGLNTEEMTAQVRQNFKGYNQNLDYTESYDGTVGALKLGDTLYTEEMTALEFQERFYPLELLNTELYPEQVWENQEEGTLYTFLGATEVEEWLGYGELISAEATALVGAEGITAMTYDVVTQTGGINRHLVLDVAITYPETTPEIILSETEEAVEISYLSAPVYMRMGFAAMSGSESRELNQDRLVTLAATGEVVLANTTTSLYCKDDVLAMKETGSTEVRDAYGETVLDEDYELLIKDGVMTIEMGGETTTYEEIGTKTTYQTLLTNELRGYMVNPENLTEANLEMVGTGLYITFKGNEDAGRDMESRVVGDLYSGDSDYLMDVADGYVTNTLEGYMGIDLMTMLPTSYGISYQGTHTIEGYECPLVLEYSSAMELGSISAYHNITEEHMPLPEPENKPTPVFYQVTDAEGHTLWLMGTIHVGDNRILHLPQEIYDAFDASDALAVEFDGDSFNEELENNPELLEQIANAYYYTDESTIEQHFTDEELYDEAVKAMKAAGRYTYYSDYMKPFVWEQDLSNVYLALGRGLSSQFGVDNQLMDRARTQEKEILDVESGEMQIQMMSDYSDAVQEYILSDTVYSNAISYCLGVQKLFEMWCRGDETELREYLNEEDDLSEMTEEELAVYNEYNEAMLTNRNIDMLAVAEDYLASGKTVFYAVGLAHLLGTDGLVDALREAGYTVTLVTYGG